MLVKVKVLVLYFMSGLHGGALDSELKKGGGGGGLGDERMRDSGVVFRRKGGRDWW